MDVKYKIYVGPAFFLGGAALVEAAVHTISQVQPISIWVFILLAFGIIFCLGGLIILLSLVQWHQLGYNILRIWNWRGERQQKREFQEFIALRRPQYIIQQPDINPQPINPQDSVPNYAAKFTIEITNQPACIAPINVFFNQTKMTLEQASGYGSYSMTFMCRPLRHDEQVPVKETRKYEIAMVGCPDSSSPPYLDLSQCYNWVIEGPTLIVFGLREADVVCHKEGQCLRSLSSIIRP